MSLLDARDPAALCGGEIGHDDSKLYPEWFSLVDTLQCTLVHFKLYSVHVRISTVNCIVNILFSIGLTVGTIQLLNDPMNHITFCVLRAGSENRVEGLGVIMDNILFFLLLKIRQGRSTYESFCGRF